MKKTIPCLIATAILFSVTAPIVSSASTVLDTPPANSIEKNSDKFDEFISVSNNQFVFKQSSGYKISEQTLLEVKSVLSDSNKFIRDNNLIIDPTTKTASQIIMLRSYGKNGILKVRWNSVTIGIDKGLTNDIIHAGIAGGAGYLGFLASGPGAAAVASIVSVIVDRHLDSRSGWWFDFNFFTKTITGFGRQ